MGPAVPEILWLRANESATTQKLVAMATSLEELEKNGPDSQHSHKYLPFGEKIVKIGPVDTEIALLIIKKEKSKKLTQAKYIAGRQVCRAG